MIDNNVIQAIVASTDIVALVGKYLTLTKKGSNYWAYSPFKTERTPSFCVSETKQIFKCFSTNVGGDCIAFLMHIDNLSFVDACTALALASGINLVLSDNTSSVLTKQLISTLTALQSLYLSDFNDSPAFNYLVSRNLISIANAFNLGYDKTNNKLTVPIYNTLGHLVAFAYRVLDDSKPKYINTKETSIYSKGKLLYGLSIAKEDIKQLDLVYLVEGYSDMWKLWQLGIKNVVACCGTSFTNDQAKLILRYTRNIVIMLDGDNAGKLATYKALTILLPLHANVKVVLLPENSDPSDIDNIDSIVPLNPMQYLIQYNDYTDDAPIEIVDSFLANVSTMLDLLPTGFTRALYIDYLSKHTKIPQTALVALQNITGDTTIINSPNNPNTDDLIINADPILLDKLVVLLLYQYRNTQHFDYIKENVFNYPLHDSIESIKNDLCNNNVLTPESLSLIVGWSMEHSISTKWNVKYISDTDRIAKVVGRLHLRHIKRLLDAVLMDLKTANDDWDKVTICMTRISNLNAIKFKLANLLNSSWA